MRRLSALVLALLLVGVLLAGCSSDDGDDAADGADATTTSEGSAATTAEPTGDPLLVNTELGQVQGAESEVDGVRAFLGIPYAAEPTGDDAWRPPQAREPYDGVFDATQPAGSCPQNTDDPLAQLTPIPDPVDDCLTLSVWAPDDAEGLPVMFWIHGGGLTSGSANQPFYVGDDLAAEGVVVVNVNYRLGAFGFLASEELADESDDGAYGNYGFLDQVAGLEWVRDNIAAFGGDPDNVTIFGESAGGSSVCGHLASPASEGLFERAIIQSAGGCGWFLDAAEAHAAADAYLAEAGCADVACLRTKPTSELAPLPFEGAALVTDGVVLDEPAIDLAAEGAFDDIPVIIGSNGTEMTLFTLSIAELSDDELRARFAEVTDDPDALLELYPANDYESNVERYRTMLTEVNFTCPTIEYARTATGPTYVYHYVWDSPNDPFGVGPTHGAELVPLFGHPEGIAGLPESDPSNPAQDDDRAVSDQVQAAWVGFATNGELDPEQWEPYREAERITLIDRTIQLVDTIRDGRCDEVIELSSQTR